METVNILMGLRDVEGIIGSFVVSAEGTIAGRDLPAMFDDETLQAVAPRLLRLRDGIASDAVDPTALVLRYSEHKLHVRPAGSSLLCVLSESKVNTPALRVGMKLVARRVEPLVTSRPPAERRSPVPPPVTQRSGVTTPVAGHAQPAPAQPSSAQSGMIYRGQRVTR